MTHLSFRSRTGPGSNRALAPNPDPISQMACSSLWLRERDTASVDELVRRALDFDSCCQVRASPSGEAHECRLALEGRHFLQYLAERTLGSDSTFVEVHHHVNIPDRG